MGDAAVRLDPCGTTIGVSRIAMASRSLVLRIHGCIVLLLSQGLLFGNALWAETGYLPQLVVYIFNGNALRWVDYILFDHLLFLLLPAVANVVLMVSLGIHLIGRHWKIAVGLVHSVMYGGAVNRLLE